MTDDDQRAAVECMALAMTRTTAGFEDAAVPVALAKRLAKRGVAALLDAGWSVLPRGWPDDEAVNQASASLGRMGKNLWAADIRAALLAAVKEPPK